MTDGPAPDMELLGRRVAALGMAKVPGGTAKKRFVRSIQGRAPETLTDRQRAYVEALCWTFRRQLPPTLVPASKPAPSPP